MSDLTKVLTMLECEPEEQRILTAEIGTLRRLRVLKRESLEKVDGIGAGMIDEIMYVKDWYLQWVADGLDSLETIEEAFTRAKWDAFLDDAIDVEMDKKQKLADLNIKIKTEELSKAKAGSSVKSSSNAGVNMSYKVEAN